MGQSIAVRDRDVIAVEAVDLCVGRLMKAARAAGAVLVVTADHGNADDMVERAKDGTPKTDENGRPVPPWEKND